MFLTAQDQAFGFGNLSRGHKSKVNFMSGTLSEILFKLRHFKAWRWWYAYKNGKNVAQLRQTNIKHLATLDTLQHELSRLDFRQTVGGFIFVLTNYEVSYENGILTITQDYTIESKIGCDVKLADCTFQQYVEYYSKK